MSGVVVLIIGISAALSSASGGKTHPAASHSVKVIKLPGNGSASFSPQPAQSAQPAKPPVPAYTIAQRQAIDSAKSYLQSEPGFSKLGLIDQLHSKYGEGFSKKLAVFAVNHIKVNWRQQAVYSARNYMKNEPGWSCSGLIQQLDSPYGEQFTPAQAEYAARAVGLC